MSSLDVVRRLVRMSAWAGSLGLAAALTHALLAVEAAPLLEPLGPSAAFAGLTLLLALATFVIVWLATRLIDLGALWGAASGAVAGLLPLGVVLAIEGPASLSSARPLLLRAISILLAVGAGALGARRREPIADSR